MLEGESKDSGDVKSHVDSVDFFGLTTTRWIISGSIAPVFVAVFVGLKSAT